MQPTIDGRRLEVGDTVGVRWGETGDGRREGKDVGMAKQRRNQRRDETKETKPIAREQRHTSVNGARGQGGTTSRPPSRPSHCGASTPTESPGNQKQETVQDTSVYHYHHDFLLHHPSPQCSVRVHAACVCAGASGGLSKVDGVGTEGVVPPSEPSKEGVDPLPSSACEVRERRPADSALPAK
ncbi:hypothetical protein C8Q80DRAFT_1136926 [Daedaleopsis nitida]|nr:hypothetical protein C8Q80DRAFT_1136926 [Daedaleopsis nitida]